MVRTIKTKSFFLVFFIVSFRLDCIRSLPDPRAPLPSPRLIVNTLGEDTDAGLDHRHSAMLMQFGQFLVHDISFTPSGFGPRNCCSNDRDNNCFPILIPEGDTVFKDRCNSRFSRSAQFCRKPFSAREQVREQKTR